MKNEHSIRNEAWHSHMLDPKARSDFLWTCECVFPDDPVIALPNHALLEKMGIK